jgi:hypothetical protein
MGESKLVTRIAASTSGRNWRVVLVFAAIADATPGVSTK